MESPPKPGIARFFRFRLRTIFALMFLTGFGLMISNRYERHQANEYAVKQIQLMGGSVVREPNTPELLDNLFPKRFWGEITEVTLHRPPHLALATRPGRPPEPPPPDALDPAILRTPARVRLSSLEPGAPWIHDEIPIEPPNSGRPDQPRWTHPQQVWRWTRSRP